MKERERNLISGLIMLPLLVAVLGYCLWSVIRSAGVGGQSGHTAMGGRHGDRGHRPRWIFHRAA